ncbi:MAG TPA: tetratricopeptide repeat protein [Terriglobales bacterium]|nr:tetratricopeptide repeat protein [Terriglobales bacterium]
MKPAALTFMVLLFTVLLIAQQQPAQAPASSPNPQAGAQAAPPTKRPPQAKTQAEFDAYQAAMKNANDPAAMEKAADDFAAKFPTSELRDILYRVTMRGYQNVDNGDKMAETAGKLLKIDPDDPEALVNQAEIAVEHTRDTDLDKDQRLDDAAKGAQHALQSVDTDIPTGVQPQQVEMFKNMVKSTAYSILGGVAEKREKYAEAEDYYRKSIAADPAHADPILILRLALALDKQGKYPDALKEANRAVDMTQENTTPGKLARQEKDRLVQLTGGGTPPPASKPAAGGQTPPSQ